MTATAIPAFASWGSRALSTIVDGLIVGVVTVPFLIIGLSPHLVTNGELGNQAQSLVFTKHPVFLALVVVVQIVWAIYVMFAVSGPRGATVGMRAAKIRIVDTQYSGISKGRAIVRYLVHNPLVTGLDIFSRGIGVLYALLDILWPLWNKKHQSIHDLIVKTYVVVASQ
jgi:uncharacterized RDD family membrane protein YckC